MNFIAFKDADGKLYDSTDRSTDRINYSCLTPLGLALVSISKHCETNP